MNVRRTSPDTDEADQISRLERTSIGAPSWSTAPDRAVGSVRMTGGWSSAPSTGSAVASASSALAPGSLVPIGVRSMPVMPAGRCRWPSPGASLSSTRRMSTATVAANSIAVSCAELHPEVFIATKMGRRAEQVPENYCRQNFLDWNDRSRANLGVEQLDLVQLHCPPDGCPRERRRLCALEEMVSAGGSEPTEYRSRRARRRSHRSRAHMWRRSRSSSTASG